LRPGRGPWWPSGHEPVRAPSRRPVVRPRAGAVAVAGFQEEHRWDAPDFSEMTEGDPRAWWTDAIAFPDEFRYIADPT